MAKYISIFFLGIGSSIILFFIFASIFDDSSPGEFAAVTFGCIIIILVSFLIALLYYVIDLVKKLK
ncbi:MULTISPECIES: hypothetical protein [Bacillus]|uniref:Uncharacterized protein n=1 Tax=Bacillus infantis NRRL B-14911 TaxID=1367477 RepID=U5LDC0_9BACI|nr:MULTISPECIES: hypothetical protein [Bacillus]OXT18152.1 hypothetical protein B9K06_06485 [Bacillus sp. OG2]AGX04671.1 hypothetical protein N288_13845 [Bacillus infantis NRRL B-14911]EAR68256.1 hypothetical protein B14911_26395 [Bacillus sp. NRRL B-14911]MCK6205579.1 hypothetical protein [Bacillus infantis]MDT0163381.1 hypothetical protein [Bacillus sp. AG4(2022)]